MRKLLTTLLAVIALPPTAVNAEILKVPKIQFYDALSEQVFWGQMVTICYADKKGYLKNNEKEQLISFATEFHETQHEVKSTLKETQQEVISEMKQKFPNCLS